jgi:ADP-dependent NAD(P)H-hydrate dehydratase / NAD(P)H-hydrate epimerase
MIKVVSVEKMRQIEAAADAGGLTYATMMQNAGGAVARRVLQILAGRPDARVTVLVGAGNNGGDGLVAGHVIAKEESVQVRFYLLKTREDSDSNFKAVRDAGLFIASAEDDRDFRVLRNMVASADVVIDALFGIGVRLPLKADVAKVMRNVSQALNDRQHPEHPEGKTIVPAMPESKPSTRPYVVAVDCPSGLNCDTGDLDKNAISADETMTFIGAKPGLFEFPGAAAVGKLQVATIGVPSHLPELHSESRILVDAEFVRGIFPARPPNSNKGTFGKALIIAGSMNYTGAPGLSALAAYRVGTGLVTVGAPAPVVSVLSSRFLEPTWLLLPHDMGVLASNAAQVVLDEMGQYSALLLGPGWGREQITSDFLTTLLKASQHSGKRRVHHSMGFLEGQTQSESETTKDEVTKLPPLVIDADGLNLLSEIDEWWTLLPEGTIITPHPGEMGRLAKLETREVLADRWAIASSKAAEWNVTLVLKGAHTLIASPDGRTAVLPFKTDALATAGTGDILAGIIVGLLAHGISPFEAAVLGGYIHGLAGTLAGKNLGITRSVIAGDVLEAIAEAVSLLENRLWSVFD